MTCFNSDIEVTKVYLTFEKAFIFFTVFNPDTEGSFFIFEKFIQVRQLICYKNKRLLQHKTTIFSYNN
jgi:hypothetical protein